MTKSIACTPALSVTITHNMVLLNLFLDSDQYYIAVTKFCWLIIYNQQVIFSLLSTEPAQKNPLTDKSISHQKNEPFDIYLSTTLDMQTSFLSYAY